ncbi:MG406 family protein [Mycoplasmoides alvi]|uniref:MG406 family protein n=1 Tax=Mycoplasmoides alvi TaxID=78580 RepID=UPI00051B35AE|nr:MG406 family protein [Mycoplasmoides alvi]
MFNTKQTKWLFLIYSGLCFIGIIVLLIICGLNLTPWGSLYGWLLVTPFAILAMISYTLIPNFLLNYSKKKKEQQNKVIMSLSILIYILRYIFYALPILIAGGINGFKLEGVFNVIPTIVAIILIPISSIVVNYLLFWIDYRNHKQKEEGKKYVPTGDSLAAI